VKRYEQGNLCLSKFCQEQGVNTRTFTKWKRKFSVEESKPFIPVAIESAEASPVLNVYEISHPNGFSLKCNDQADTETVKRLLKAIGGVL
jgi:hypothetical protein